jgi:c(7)-type cytochrome triheme protein
MFCKKLVWSAFFCMLALSSTPSSVAEMLPSPTIETHGKEERSSRVYSLPEVAPIEERYTPHTPIAEIVPNERSDEPEAWQNEIYDPTNLGFKKLQKANESMAGFPVDQRGFVDWMKALKSGLIHPRADKLGKTTKEVFDLNVVMKLTKQMPYVLFPHSSHTMWLDCSNCHPSIFIPKANANPIKMPEILQGKWCGVCHGKVAFPPIYSCDRCHRVENPAFPFIWPAPIP